MSFMVCLRTRQRGPSTLALAGHPLLLSRRRRRRRRGRRRRRDITTEEWTRYSPTTADGRSAASDSLELAVGEHSRGSGFHCASHGIFSRQRGPSVAGAATLAQRSRCSCEAAHRRQPNPTFRDGHHSDCPARHVGLRAAGDHGPEQRQPDRFAWEGNDRRSRQRPSAICKPKAKGAPTVDKGSGNSSLPVQGGR